MFAWFVAKPYEVRDGLTRDYFSRQLSCNAVVRYMALSLFLYRERIRTQRPLHGHQRDIIFLLPVLACEPLQLTQQQVYKLLAAPCAGELLVALLAAQTAQIQDLRESVTRLELAR